MLWFGLLASACASDLEPGRSFSRPRSGTPSEVQLGQTVQPGGAGATGGSSPANGASGAGGTGGLGGAPVTQAGSGGGDPVPQAAGTGAPVIMGGPSEPPAGRVFDAGSDPARNMVQAGQVCARLSQILCAGEAYCCDDPGRDVASCESALNNDCMTGAYLDAITLDARSGFDPTAAATAFTQLEQLASQCDTSIGSFSISPQGLMSMLRGTVAAGGACPPGLSGDQAQAAAALASCQNPATTACLPTSALSFTCAPRGGVGSVCFTDLNCQDGLYCPNPNLDIGTATCAARKPVGAACQSGNECQTLVCIANSCAALDAQSEYCLALAQ